MIAKKNVQLFGRMVGAIVAVTIFSVIHSAYGADPPVSQPGQRDAEEIINVDVLKQSLVDAASGLSGKFSAADLLKTLDAFDHALDAGDHRRIAQACIDLDGQLDRLQKDWDTQVIKKVRAAADVLGSGLDKLDSLASTNPSQMPRSKQRRVAECDSRIQTVVSQLQNLPSESRAHRRLREILRRQVALQQLLKTQPQTSDFRASRLTTAATSLEDLERMLRDAEVELLVFDIQVSDTRSFLEVVRETSEIAGTMDEVYAVVRQWPTSGVAGVAEASNTLSDVQLRLTDAVNVLSEKAVKLGGVRSGASSATKLPQVSDEQLDALIASFRKDDQLVTGK